VIFTPSEIGRAIFSVGKAVLKMDTSWMMRNMQLLRDDCQFQIVSEAIFLIIYLNNFIIKVKILKFIKWSHSSPPDMLTIEPRMVNKF
jgi:hypothetical protein